MADSRVRFVPQRVARSAFRFAETVHMGLVPVFVYDVNDVHDGVSWVPHKEMFEKFGYVLNVGESETFLNDLSSVCIAELEAREAMALDVKDSHFSSLGVMR